VAGAETGHDEMRSPISATSGGFANLLLVEQPNGDFAQTMVRQLLYAAFIDPWWRAMTRSGEVRLAAIAAKAEKEDGVPSAHLRRMGHTAGDGRRRAIGGAAAVDRLWPYTGELFEAVTEAVFDHPRTQFAWSGADGGGGARRSDAGGARPGVDADRRARRAAFEQLGHLLAEMQHLQRSHPGARVVSEDLRAVPGRRIRGVRPEIRC